MAPLRPCAKGALRRLVAQGALGGGPRTQPRVGGPAGRHKTARLSRTYPQERILHSAFAS
jgi:hypothetical protein